MKLPNKKFGTILADPPWRFKHRTGKIGPEHKRLHRYSTLSLDELMDVPVWDLSLPRSHLYLWCPSALLPDGLMLMESWGFTYKTIFNWIKVTGDGQPDRRGMGFYFRTVTEQILFGVRGRLRTGPAGRSQVNVVMTRRRDHSRKPEEVYEVIERCSPGPYLELFARDRRYGWTQCGDQLASRRQRR